MADFTLYVLILVIAVVIAKYTVPFVLSITRIPYHLVTVVNLVLSLGIFGGIFFVLYFSPQPRRFIYQIFVEPEVTLIVTPSVKTDLPSSSSTSTPTKTLMGTSAFVPTSTPVLTGTSIPTTTPVLTATMLSGPVSTPAPILPNTPTPLPSDTPTPSPSLNFHTISLSHIANASTQEGYTSPPLGLVELDGILFDLPPGQNSVTTQAEPLPNFPTSFSLDTEVFNPQEIYLLITGGNIFSKFNGSVVGTVRLYFSGGESFSTPLIAGQNIREWKLLDERTVSTTSNSRVKEVWRTKSTHGGTGVVDLLEIDLPDRYQADSLVAIEILDTSTETTGSMDPALNLIGVTVLGY